MKSTCTNQHVVEAIWGGGLRAKLDVPGDEDNGSSAAGAACRKDAQAGLLAARSGR